MSNCKSWSFNHVSISSKIQAHLYSTRYFTFAWSLLIFPQSDWTFANMTVESGIRGWPCGFSWLPMTYTPCTLSLSSEEEMDQIKVNLEYRFYNSCYLTLIWVFPCFFFRQICVVLSLWPQNLKVCMILRSIQQQWLVLPEVVRMHMADVDEVCCTESIQAICWRLMEKPPASGKSRTLQPRVKHEPFLSKLQLHAGMSEVCYLKEKFKFNRKTISQNYIFSKWF